MRNKIFAHAIFLVLLMVFLSGNKGFSQIHCKVNCTYETPFVKMTTDKHYIKPGAIVFNADGLFLLLQGYLIPINGVESDASGTFIRPQAYELERCPGCGWPLTPWVHV